MNLERSIERLDSKQENLEFLIHNIAVVRRICPDLEKADALQSMMNDLAVNHRLTDDQIRLFGEFICKHFDHAWLESTPKPQSN